MQGRIMFGVSLRKETPQMRVGGENNNIHMSHFSYACKTEGGNGISCLISALCVNFKFTSECYSGIFQIN